MPRRRAPAAAGLQPPELPATLSPAAAPPMLFDGASFAGALLVDADLSASQAADLLLEPEATLASVARQVGYANPFALSSAFKRVRGISPQQHRAAPRPSN